MVFCIGGELSSVPAKYCFSSSFLYCTVLEVTEEEYSWCDFVLRMTFKLEFFNIHSFLFVLQELSLEKGGFMSYWLVSRGAFMEREKSIIEYTMVWHSWLVVHYWFHWWYIFGNYGDTSKPLSKMFDSVWIYPLVHLCMAISYHRALEQTGSKTNTK